MVGAYAEPFTLTVIADLEGVPESDHSLFRRRLSTAHQDVGHKPLEFLYDRFSEYIEDRRREPRNDVLGGLATATFPDGSIPEVRMRRCWPPTCSPAVRRRPCGCSPSRSGCWVSGPTSNTSSETTGRGSRTSLRRHFAWRARSGPSSAWRVSGPSSPAWRSRQGPRHARTGRVQPRSAGVRQSLRVRHRPWETPANTSPSGTASIPAPARPLARAEGRVTINQFLDRTSDITISEEHHGAPGERQLRIPTDLLPPGAPTPLPRLRRRQLRPGLRCGLGPRSVTASLWGPPRAAWQWT